MANTTNTNTNETTKRDITTTISIVNGVGTLTLDFANGEKLVMDTDRIDFGIRDQALCHGLKQKLVDAAAIARSPITGGTADIADKYNAVKEVYDRLLAGECNKARAAGTGEIRGGLLLAALVRLYPARSLETLREFLNGKNKKEQATLRANPKIARVIDEIRAERATATGVDSDELLDELEG